MRAMDYLYTLSGFAVGAIVGLTGVGGGSLMTPLLAVRCYRIRVNSVQPALASDHEPRRRPGRPKSWAIN